MYFPVRRNAGIENPHFRETFLPDRRTKPKLPPCPECKATFDELHSPLNRHLAFDGEQSVEVIGHNHEFMQAEFSLGAIVVQHANE